MTKKKDDSTKQFQLRRVGQPATVKEVKDIMIINQDVTTFGRRQGKVEYFLDSKIYQNMISRSHAELRRSWNSSSGEYDYELLDTSLNGTYVNDTRVDGTCQLHHGDIIIFGHLNGINILPGQTSKQSKSEFKFKFEYVGQEKDSPADSSDESAYESKEIRSNKKTNIDISKGNETPSHKFGIMHKSGKNKATPVLKDVSNTRTGGEKRDSGLGSDKDFDNHSDDETDRDLHTLAAGISAAEKDEDDNDDDDDDEDDSTPEADRDDSPMQGHSRTKGKVKTSAAVNKQPKRKFGSSEPSTTSQSGEKKRRRLKIGKGKPNNSQDEVQWYDGEECVKGICKRPQDPKVQWVQCDGCDKWYHTTCVGCDYEKVKDEPEFYCGYCKQPKAKSKKK